MPDPFQNDPTEPRPADVPQSSVARDDPPKAQATSIPPSQPPTPPVNPPNTAGITAAALEPEAPPRHVSPKKPRRPNETQPGPKNFADLQRKTHLQREWFARIRIREDRLARLWVSNLAAHDVVVWSKKEKRWVALLAVPELRRALRHAEAELPKDPVRPSEPAPQLLSRPPHVLPPSPPLAMLNSAQAGVGEFRLRSIAQTQGNVKSRVLDWRRPTQESHLAFVRSRSVRDHQSEQSESEFADASPRSNFWRWRAIERLLWVGVGVVAVLVVSTAGSMDEQPIRLEPVSLVLTADSSDANREVLSLGEQLLGAENECKVRPSEPAPSPSEPQPEQRVETDQEPATSLVRGRPTGDVATRPPQQAPHRSITEPRDTAEVPADLNFQAIRAALFNAAALAHGCPGERVRGRAVVTFEPNGSVRSVDLPLLIGERPDRDCIARNFKNLRVPPFSGHPVAVKKDF